MEQNTKAYEQVRTLTDLLNQYRHEYYNLSAPSVSDQEYDRLFDELAALEKQTGIVMSNSPTQTVGYPSVSELPKATHTIPLLSLDKVKSEEEMLSFVGGNLVLIMLKLDGLTLKLTYEDGTLQEAAVRGDGYEGDIVTHNARAIKGIPLQIPHKERLVVTGEAFIRPSDFAALKETVRDRNGKPYKNARNLASGSIRLLDASACQKRRLEFRAFNVLEGFEEHSLKSDRLTLLKPLGFLLCSYLKTTAPLSLKWVKVGIEQMQKLAEEQDLPIDGIVFTFNDVAYSKSCGQTNHHYKDGMAFKFEDDTYESQLQYIEWNTSRSGEIAPVAVFDTVEIDGCEVSRASLHNLSFIEKLELMPGNHIKVSKRNMIIPHVEENLDRGGFDMEKLIPHTCPCCGEPTRIHAAESVADGQKRITKTLHCDNPRCETRRLRQFVHFAGEKAMDIEGLSESKLEKFIGCGFLHNYMDIYRLDEYRDQIIRMEGFGEKSWQNLWDAIQRSRDTTFQRYLIAMDIPMIGNNASKTLAQQFHSSLEEFEDAVVSGYDFTQLPDFGETLCQNIHDWFQNEDNWYVWYELQELVCIAPPAAGGPVLEIRDNPFVGKTVVVTGKVEPYNRGEINAKIESLGAHAGSSVSSKTDYLICGENAGSKLDKARQLGIPVLSLAEFFHMADCA